MKCHLLDMTQWPSYPRTHSCCTRESQSSVLAWMREGAIGPHPSTEHLVAGAGRRATFPSGVCMATGGLPMLLQAVLIGLSELYKKEKEAMNVGGAGVRGGWGEWERRVGGVDIIKTH